MMMFSKHRKSLLSHRIQTDVAFSRGSRRRFHSSTDIPETKSRLYRARHFLEPSWRIASLNVLSRLERTMQAIGADNAIFT
jgi:hypothetical protein